MKKILLVSDGIIVINVVGQGNLELSEENVGIVVTGYGVELMIRNTTVCLPASVLEHLERAEGINIYFYESDPYEIVAEYKGVVALDRDEVLKVKGAWEYQAPGQHCL